MSGSPCANRLARRSSANRAKPTATDSKLGESATTSTLRPCISQVEAVACPMAAMMEVVCGLPAMPIMLRTADDEVNTTASNNPVLMRSLISAGGGAARTVR